jgi:virulence-associated protein VapD
MSTQNYLSEIKKVIHEHEVIHASIKAVRNNNTNFSKTLSEAQKSGWPKNSIQTLLQDLQRLNERLTDLEDGFKIHYQLDEVALLHIVGDLMIRAIQINHKEMLRQFDEIRQTITNTSVQQIQETSYIIVNKVEILCQLVETHIQTEAGMLQMLSKAL